MKLRQKLAMVLAAAMVVTAVPVTTMAKSTSGMTKVVSAVENTPIKASDKVFVEVKIDGTGTNGDDTTEFIVQAKDFKFNVIEYARYASTQSGTDTVDVAETALENALMLDGTVAADQANLVKLGLPKNAQVVKVELKYDGLEVDGAAITYKVPVEAVAKTTGPAIEYGKEITKTVTVATLNNVVSGLVGDVNDATKGAANAGFGTEEPAPEEKSIPAVGKVGYNIQVIDEDIIKVGVRGVKKDTVVAIPVIGTVKKGTPALQIIGDDSVVTSAMLPLAGEVVSSKTLAVTAGDKEFISVEGFGTLGKFTIDEKVIKTAPGKEITLKLANSADLKFVDGDEILLTGKLGYAGQKTKFDGKNGTGAVASTSVTLDVSEDGRTAKFTVPAFTSTLRGAVEVTDVQVKARDAKKDCRLGDVKVTVTEEADKTLEKTVLTLAEVVDHGISITTTKDFEIEAGRGTKELEITIKENAVDTLSNRRDLYIKAENVEFVRADATDDAKFYNYGDAVSLFVDGEEVVGGAKIVDGELVINTDKLTADERNEIKVKVLVHTTATKEGDITLTATSRDLEDDIEHVAGKVTAPFTVEYKGMTVKVGLQGQVDEKASITIKEADFGKLEQGTKLTLSVPKDYGIDFTDATTTVKEGDIELKTKRANNVLTITVDRESGDASTIVIDNIKVDVNRSVAEGTFNATLGGDAVCNIEVYELNDEKKDVLKGDTVKLKDFITIGTKNTEDLNNASKLSEVKVTADATSYVLNGETLEVPNGLGAYINEDNRMMAPLRLVGDAFGATYSFGHVEGKGVITFFKDGKVVRFENGSAMMNVGGVEIPMTTAVVIKNDYTFVPMRDLANALSIDVQWDGETSTATFTNK